MEGYLATGMQLGYMLGSYTWCYLSDRYGRMYSFKKSPILLALTGFVMVFSYNYEMFIILLVLMGFAIGGELTVGGTVFSELCPPMNINRLASLSFSWGVGGIFSTLIGIFAVAQNFTSIQP